MCCGGQVTFKGVIEEEWRRQENGTTAVILVQDFRASFVLPCSVKRAMSFVRHIRYAVLSIDV